MPDLRQRKQEERFKTKDSLQSVQDIAAGFARNLQGRPDGDSAGEQSETYAVDKLEKHTERLVQRVTQTPEQVVSRARSTFLKQRREEAAHDSGGVDAHLPDSKSSDGNRQGKSSLSVKEKQAPQPKTRGHAEQFRQRPASPCRSSRTAAYRSASSRAAEQGRKKYRQSAKKKMSQQTQKAAKKPPLWERGR